MQRLKLSPMTHHMLLLFPKAQFIDPRDATLLGSPIDDISSITASISKKTGLLSLMGERLQHIFLHDAILYSAMLLPSQSFCNYCGHHPVFSQPHFNAMMMNYGKFFVPSLTSALVKQPGPRPHFQFDLGALAFGVLYS